MIPLFGWFSLFSLQYWFLNCSKSDKKMTTFFIENWIPLLFIHVHIRTFLPWRTFEFQIWRTSDVKIVDIVGNPRSITRRSSLCDRWSVTEETFWNQDHKLGTTVYGVIPLKSKLLSWGQIVQFLVQKDQTKCAINWGGGGGGERWLHFYLFFSTLFNLF